MDVFISDASLYHLGSDKMHIIISSCSSHTDAGPHALPPQQRIIHPQSYLDTTPPSSLSTSPNFKDLAAQRLSGAVKIPTITYDGMARVGEDPRWEIFYSMTKYLQETFLCLHKELELVNINEHGLLYTWQGTDNQLKPLLFMAHTDVVPAPSSTLDCWTYPPFSGHYDGKYIWGRGSEDDKSNLIAILSAIEALLESGFRATRTVIVSIGFDEEGGADQSYGAKCLSEHILKTYGEDGIELIFDEGIAGIEEHFGTDFALLATAEKGYMDVSITIDTAGGHSSTPPDHTAIGYLAQVIGAIEANPFESRLTPRNPTTEFLNRTALYSRDMPSSLREAILNSPSSSKVLKYMDSSLETRALVRTSTAVDVIRGGEKCEFPAAIFDQARTLRSFTANALPETAYALVNHRIAVEDSVESLKDHYVRILAPLANKWNYKLHAFGIKIGQKNPSAGIVTLSGIDELEPSPVSCHEDVRFSWLAGTLCSVFGEDLHVAPVLLTGNTDTKFYWKLSSQIYRFSPWHASLDPRGTTMHTVDERMPVEGLLEMIKFYHKFIRIVDEKRR